MSEPDHDVEPVGKSHRGHETKRTGIGLIVGLAAGHRALLAAAAGGESYATPLGSFVMVVLASVGGTLLLGFLYDRFNAENPDDLDDEDESSDELDQETTHAEDNLADPNAAVLGGQHG